MTITRAEQKERTRRAILDAALDLCADSSLAVLSLRQVAKEVGIVPTAFYRHFASIEELGLALVEESFETLRVLLRDVRRQSGSTADLTLIDDSIDVVISRVREQPQHFTFIARERVAGPPAVRAAVLHELDLVEQELAVDLGTIVPLEQWSPRDLRTLAALIVDVVVIRIEALITSPQPRSGDEALTAATARRQLRMLMVGALHWRDDLPPPPE